MELQFLFNFPLLFTLLLIIVFASLSRIGSKRKAEKKQLNLPPGPIKLPVIGNVHQLAGYPDPLDRIRDLANTYGKDLLYLQLGEVKTLIVSSAEAAKEITKTHDVIFATRPFVLALYILSYGNLDIAMAPHGEYWRQLRKICVIELLSVKRVKSFQPIRDEEASNMVRSISASTAKEGVNLSEILFFSSLGLASKAAFGKTFEDQDIFLRCVKKIVTESGGFGICDMFPSVKWLPTITGLRHRMEKLHKEVDWFLEKIIDHHRRRQSSNEVVDDGYIDLVDVLMNIQAQGSKETPLTTTSIKALIVDVFAAGSDTSSTTLEWAMSELIKNPEKLEKAQAEVRKAFDKEGKVEESRVPELNYVMMVIKETLRLHPALPLLLPRECREECQVMGYDIPAGTKVLVNAWAIGRDPTYWRDPEKFYPERFSDSQIDFKGSDFEYIPFGAGRRQCPGMSFGLSTVQNWLATLLYHFDWELPNGMRTEDLDMSLQFGASSWRKIPLYLVPTLRRPLLVD